MANSLGLQKRRHAWTGAERTKLRRIYPTASFRELTDAFPGLTLVAIADAARRFGIRREKRGFKPTGIPLIDDIRERASELGYSMVDVDELARTKKYFRCAQWFGSGKPNLIYVARAVAALDGEIGATWH